MAGPGVPDRRSPSHGCSAEDGLLPAQSVILVALGNRAHLGQGGLRESMAVCFRLPTASELTVSFVFVLDPARLLLALEL